MRIPDLHQYQPMSKATIARAESKLPRIIAQSYGNEYDSTAPADQAHITIGELVINADDKL